MFGVIRFLLAGSVMAFHLTATIPHLGIFAVNCFYAISGYLMTMVLRESYQFRLSPFAVNRFLRLYPIYFAIAAIGILFAATVPYHSHFHPSWSGTLQNGDVAGNLLMFPWAFLADDLVQVNFLNLGALSSTVLHYRVIPSTWSIGIEIACYFLLWLFCARNLWTVLVTLVVAVGWHWYVGAAGIDGVQKYNPIPAALLPFGLGALAYYVAGRLPRVLVIGSGVRAQTALFLALLALFCGNWYASTKSSVNLFNSVPYYANYAIAFIAVVLINRTRLSGLTGKVDKWLGDISYPMFLGHYVFAFIAWRLLGDDAPARSWTVFLFGGALTIASSVVLVMLIDRRLVWLRNRVRERRRPESPVGGLNVLAK